MSDCEHAKLVKDHQFVHFCPDCGITICQVTGVIRDRHGKIIGNVLHPNWKPAEVAE